MPKPKRSRSALKSTAQRVTTRVEDVDVSRMLDAFMDRADGRQYWSDVCKGLTEILGIPNLDSRSGIKRIHANFDQFQRRLEETFVKYSYDDQVLGGIMEIWAKMSVDGFLRVKLLTAGLTLKIGPLLDIPRTRIVGLRALATLTCHGDASTGREIASLCVPWLLRLMEQYPNDDDLNEQAIHVLSHIAEAVFRDENSLPSTVTRNIYGLGITRVFRLIVAHIRKPGVSSAVFHHALQLFVIVCNTCGMEIKATPTIVEALVASLRSRDLSTRVTGLTGIFGLASLYSEDDIQRVDISRIENIQRLPMHLKLILTQGNPVDSDMGQTPKYNLEYRRVMLQSAQDRDLYTLGHRLAKIIVRTDISWSGPFETLNTRTGELRTPNVGLPFTEWADALKHCARALREKGSPDDLDAADIVDLKRMIKESRNNLQDAVQFAKKAIDRNPNVAYFYYGVGLGDDQSDGLRYLKKGLQCKETLTPYLRRSMSRLAVGHAGELAFSILRTATPGTENYAVGVAFLNSAREDAKNFVEFAGLDTRSMLSVLNWCILLELVTRGPEISTDLRELKPILDKFKPAGEFLQFLNIPIRNTVVKLAKDVAVRRYASAWREWGSVIAYMDSQYSSSDPHHHSATFESEGNLSKWLEGLSIADEHDKPHHIHSRINASMLALYQCSYCRNPSAILRKCSGCEKARYCDTSCQKSHWLNHKVACKAAQAQT